MHKGLVLKQVWHNLVQYTSNNFIHISKISPKYNSSQFSDT